ncbi:MAG: protein-L-isoaspartate O-methyltransferase [Rhizobiaceae bacterium]
MASENGKPTDTNVQAVRRHYAELFAAASASPDPRLTEIVASIPRENFVGPGPWTIVINGRRVVTPSADPAYLYSNNLVALDDERNNGEPFLHAAWIGKIEPKPGEIVTHIGAGTGYYTAILSGLVEPRGEVFAFEIDAGLAARAVANLKPYMNVTTGHADAVTAELPPSDIIYVNAGVVAPPLGWLKILKQGGRLIFPWRPIDRVGVAAVVTRHAGGFAFDPFMSSWFIPCVGASIASAGSKLPTPNSARRTRSLWLTEDRKPDDTATAIFGDIWFSSDAIAPDDSSFRRRQRGL